MVMTSDKSGSSPKKRDDGPAWVSPKRRARPQLTHSSLVEISRQSGLQSSHGTFGDSTRFSNKMIGMGSQSPDGREFYGRSSLWKRADEKGLSCSQGIGPRSKVDLGGSKIVGPGSYEIVSSATHHKSPLDGPEYCHTTLKFKLKSSMVQNEDASPGPHAKYEVRKPHPGPKDFPIYKLNSMAHGGRHPHPEDKVGPEIAYNHPNSKCGKSASAPNLTGKGKNAKPQEDMDATGGTKKFIKSTFGMADRFKQEVGTSSPEGDMYYAHNKHLTQEDYLSGSRSCSFGAGGKVDFSNPYKGHRSAVSPVSYSPTTSIVAKTSALDGFLHRSISPILAGTRGSRNSSTHRGGDSQMSLGKMKTLSRKGDDAAGGGGVDVGPSFGSGVDVSSSA